MYGSEVVSPWGHCFQTGGLVYDIEKGYDEIVEEVLRRLEENDLFVKLEKCVWKVREVEFLGVIIGKDRVRMEKEKL